jgi:PhnB protein
MSNVKAVPEGYHTITPSIVCKNAAKAIDFYKQVFGAKELMRMDMGGMIGHAELQIGDSRLMLSDEFPGVTNAPREGGSNSTTLFMYSDKVDDLFDRAIKSGSTVVMPLANQFWGDRYGKLRDPFGHEWGLAQHVEEVLPEEMERRSKEWMAKAKGSGSKAAGQD